MENYDRDKQDQRTNSGMEDSTIEFLRARLLSERSVSRTARQRADELAKRVAELEEQLRVVSLLRMKAEKATADVLAILEGNGISDISETYDSSSDQETPCESKVCDRSSKEESSVNSKERNNESEELSGSDLDFSRVSSRSLSWKGRKDTQHSLEKYEDPSLRRQSNFASIAHTSKHRPGKSCRQIRHKESRSEAEKCKANPVKVDSLEDEAQTTSENFPNFSDEPEICGGIVERGQEKMLLKGSISGSVGSEQNGSNNGLDYNGYGGDRGMERALQHQAQLIGQYEEMEKAQREWEEKFRENSNSTPDSYDPGNHSDITEERYEIKATVPHPATTLASQTHEVRSEVAAVSKVQLNGSVPSSHIDGACLEESKSSSMPASASSTQDFAFPMAKGMRNQESVGMQNRQILGNNCHQLSLRAQHNSSSQGLHDSLGSQTMLSFPSNANGSFKKEEASGSQNEHYALVPHRASDGLGSVLDALKDARQSLEQRIDRLPFVATPVGNTVGPTDPATLPRDKVQIPVGCVGLFRLPTEFSEGNGQADLLNSSARLSLGNYYPDAGVHAAASNRFLSSPYFEIRSSLPTEDQFLSSPYVNGSRSGTQKPYFDPYLDTGLPSSSRYTYPNYPVNTTYPDLMPRLPAREAFSAAPLPGRNFSMPSPSQFPFIDDNIRPNMYR